MLYVLKHTIEFVALMAVMRCQETCLRFDTSSPQRHHCIHKERMTINEASLLLSAVENYMKRGFSCSNHCVTPSRLPNHSTTPMHKMSKKYPPENTAIGLHTQQIQLLQAMDTLHIRIYGGFRLKVLGCTAVHGRKSNYYKILE